jgi:hypothetical protein
MQCPALQVLRAVTVTLGRDQDLNDRPPAPGLRSSGTRWARLQGAAEQQRRRFTDAQYRHDAQERSDGGRRIAGLNGPKGVARDPGPCGPVDGPQPLCLEKARDPIAPLQEPLAVQDGSAVGVRIGSIHQPKRLHTVILMTS